MLGRPLFRFNRFHRPARETEFCGQRLAGDIGCRARENGRNSVRRPCCGSLTYRNCEGFCRPGNRVGLPGLDGGGRSPAKPVSMAGFPGNRERTGNFKPKRSERRTFLEISRLKSMACQRIPCAQEQGIKYPSMERILQDLGLASRQQRLSARMVLLNTGGAGY
jgi:hypothetical protein